MDKDLISRQHAIYTIDKYISGFDAIDRNFLDGLKTAKTLIKELPSAQPTQNNTHNALKSLDCIDRRAAIDALNRHLDTIPVVNNSTTEMIRRSEVMDCREIINGLPSEQPEQRKGTMLLNLNDNIKVKLTDLGKDIYYHQYDRTNKFVGKEICKPSFPKGADMRGGQEC